MGVTEAPSPLSLEPGAVRSVRAALDAAGYSLERIVEALAIKDVRALDRVPWDTVLLRLGDQPLHVLIRLFMLGAEVDAAIAEEALLPLPVEEWSRIGLIETADGSTRATLRVVPDEELMLASDWPGSSDHQIERDHVLGNNPTAALLDNITVRPPVSSFLDVGTGCGVQALVATRHADHVVATDLNPRAVNVARFNALLNDLEIECLEGDLFEPVVGRTFDLIVANPPFVISPASSFLFRDSELGGEGIARKIISTAPRLLSEGGICQLLCNWAHIEGTDFQERLASAFEGNGCDVWVLQIDEIDPAVYASGWIRSMESEPDGFKRALAEWMEFYAREAITAISWTVVTMRLASGRPNWLEFSELDEKITGRSGDHVLRCFEGRALLAASDEEGLLDLSPQVAPESRLEQSFAPEADGWAAVSGRLAMAAGLPLAGGVDAHVANLLIRCDGSTTLRQALERSAQDAGVSFDAMRGESLKIVRRLFEGGYLVV